MYPHKTRKSTQGRPKSKQQMWTSMVQPRSAQDVARMSMASTEANTRTNAGKDSKESCHKQPKEDSDLKQQLSADSMQ